MAGRLFQAGMEMGKTRLIEPGAAGEPRGSADAQSHARPAAAGSDGQRRAPDRQQAEAARRISAGRGSTHARRFNALALRMLHAFATGRARKAHAGADAHHITALHASRRRSI
jgi:hypothetical protein